MLTKKSYSKKLIWSTDIDITKLLLDESYSELFNKLFLDKRFKILQNKLKKYLENNNPELLYPKPNYLFKAFNMCPFENIKVVFIGQDPYFNNEKYNEKICPQAYGLSFSVPLEMEIPSSLQNIYKNMLKYGHIKKIPNHGCLDYWAYQGCLMLNTSLSVIDGQKNCHSNEWKWFTDKIIEEISNKLNNIVFVLWGGEAYKKIELIDLDKHNVIISSHPSGLSCYKPFQSYPAFAECDCFGNINKYLKENNKEKIIWDLI
jgi:uracil-DNA glycosylase